MDIVLLFLAKPLDKHGTTLVHSTYPPLKNVVEFEKALGAVKMIKDQIQYRSQSLLNLACGYFSNQQENFDTKEI